MAIGGGYQPHPATGDRIKASDCTTGYHNDKTDVYRCKACDVTVGTDKMLQSSLDDYWKCPHCACSNVFDARYRVVGHTPTQNYETECRTNLPKDKINPDHYQKGGIEAIDVMKAVSTPQEFRAYLRLTAMKYLYRLDSKDEPITNAKKAQWYIDRLVKEMS